ncbi:ATP-binding protein [Dechloromonas sp. H13]|uniref:ATP-binding protein n=1 Tax=Dechloromonas sp. H13 TaxID=2570193 RepID=UPI00129183D5|nr:ATP-binding protein [Dechloromonas sp. H13]
MTSWKFYGRRDELEAIKLLLTRERWFFCAISGRRRIGKTSLIREALLEARGGSGPAAALYVQIPDSDERDVVAVFTDALAAFAAANPGRLPVGVTADKLRRFSDMARCIGALCRAGIVVVIDEFQYFNRKALSAFTSLLQAEVDTLTGSASGGIFVLGSIHTEMTALLEDRGSPLYARVTDRLTLDHWDFATLFQVFADQGLDSPRDWLTFWSVFEGVPKFYRDCAYQGTFSADGRSAADRIIDTLFLSARAPLIEEAGTWFLRELRGAGVSLLRLLARQQPCAQQQLSAAYESLGDSRSFATYLATLIDRYRLVERLNPIFAQPGSRQARYQIGDNFLAAWLAAIEPAVQAARVQPPAQALRIGEIRLENHEGPTFERMVRKLMAEASRRGVADFPLTDLVHGYWNRPRDAARLIEIDIVAINETEQRVRFGSCKRSSGKHTREALATFEQHVGDFLATASGRRFKGWHQERALYSPDFPADERQSLQAAGYRCVDLNDYQRWLTAPNLN